MTSMARWAAGACLLLALLARAADSQTVGGVDTSRWHGFNLLEKFTLRGNAAYKEEDFRSIAELGFNFVRLPIDYRCYLQPHAGAVASPAEWSNFNEAVLREIDQAIEFGARYGIHVCLNLHRAPGFCINPPAEPLDLWTDEQALAAFVAHWQMFARRYRDIPPERLSFNLLNEPTRNTQQTYLKVHTRALEAIHREDPRRLVIVDGNEVGRRPDAEFLRYDNVIQATRGYHPSTISHYRANWVKGSDKWPEPRWPAPTLVGHFYGPAKPELQSIMRIKGEFPAGTQVSLNVVQLSSHATLRASTPAHPITFQKFDPKDQPQAWKVVPTDAKWVYHQPVSETRFVVRLPKSAPEIAIENVDGDWIQCDRITITLPNREPRTWTTDLAWGLRQTTHTLTAGGELIPPPGTSPEKPLVEYLKPWREIATRGETVFVGEWGCFNKTPHDVALAWMKSWLEQWKDAGFGWALWNFRGSFGIVDSGRADVRYEDWHGHKLDREMLTLLQSYARAREPQKF